MRTNRRRLPAPLLVTCVVIAGVWANGAPGAIEQAEREKIEAAVPTRASVAARRPRRLLVCNLNVRDGNVVRGHPSIPCGNYALELMGAKTGAYETVVSNDVEMFRPETIRQFDAICFNNTVGVLFDDPELRQSLLDFVRDGGGFVGIHAAAATFVQYPKYDQWPAFGRMLGAYEDGGHPWGAEETITIKVEDPSHPVNAAFDGKGFEICDEVFQFRHGYSRDKLRILLAIDPDKTDMGPSRRILPERRKDKDLAMSWVRSYGRGRVFYSSFGHNKHIFWNPKILKHFLDGIQFALGDLDASTTPSNQLASARQTQDR
jgi:type 1 glutamine amidotransferase